MLREVTRNQHEVHSFRRQTIAIVSLNYVDYSYSQMYVFALLYMRPTQYQEETCKIR